MKFDGNSITEYSVTFRERKVAKLILTKNLESGKTNVILMYTPLDKEPIVANAETKYYSYDNTLDIDSLIQKPLLDVYGRDNIFHLDVNQIR